MLLFYYMDTRVSLLIIESPVKEQRYQIILDTLQGNLSPLQVPSPLCEMHFCAELPFAPLNLLQAERKVKSIPKKSFRTSSYSSERREKGIGPLMVYRIVI